MLQWHVLQTKPRKEADVDFLLNRAGFEVFFPKIRDTFYRGGGAFFKTSPLFAGYLFLNIDFGRGESFHLVKYTRGVRKIICVENNPLPLSPEIVATIRARVDGEGVVQRQSRLEAGDKIRVRRGLLKELLGVLEKPVTPEGRVHVLLKLINYEMRAKLHWTEVEKLRVA